LKRSIAQNYSIDFGDIWQKYLKDSEIEFACFSFHVGLLLLSTFRLPNFVKIDPYNFALYRFKVGAFFEKQCSEVTDVDVYRPRGGTEKVLVTLLSRERAPQNSYRYMFVNRTGLSRIGSL